MRLSIITINYNNKPGLEKTIASVINQSFTDFEYIVIDGGSTDGSAEVLQNFKDKITYYVSEKDAGIFNAQNKGLAKATGEYCLFLNSGDYLADQNVLKNVLNKNFTADIAYGNMYIAHPNGKKEKGYMPAKITFFQMMNDTLWHPVSFIKRALFTKYGNYNETFKIASDYDFFFKVLLTKNASTFYLDEFISVFSLDGASSSPDNSAKLLTERRNIQLQYFHLSVIELFENYLKLRSLFPKTFLQKIQSLFKSNEV